MRKDSLVLLSFIVSVSVCHRETKSEATFRDLEHWKFPKSLNILSKRYKRSSVPKENQDNLKEELILIFTGDVTFDGPVRYYAHRKCSYNESFDEIKKYLDDGDIRVTNLESPVLKGNLARNELQEDKGIRHVAEERAVKALKYAGIDVASLANNHVLDVGEEGVNDTINALMKENIECSGITLGKSSVTRQKPVVRGAKGISVGFLSYCAITEGCSSERDKVRIGPAVFNLSVVKQDIADVKDKVDIVVVIVHWGSEYIPMPSRYVRSWAKKLEQFGADIIIGGHPHILQGHECLGKSLVTYSMGNFLFPTNGIHPVEKFLERKMPIPKDVEQYEKEVADIFNPSQFSYLLRIKVDRDGIKDASFLTFEIKSHPNTFCLQPKPVNGKWVKFCDPDDDYFCHDFETLFADTLDHASTNLQYKYGNLRKCLKT